MRKILKTQKAVCEISAFFYNLFDNFYNDFFFSAANSVTLICQIIDYCSEAFLADTILWHDYETWGVNPSVDFPVQFAAIRTDLDLNIIQDSKAIDWLCRIPHDYLPHPQACLVTGLTPSYSQQKGLSEPYFAAKIHQQISFPGTCTAGYNSIKFDEEVTRHLLFRNFFPVYEREFKHGNSRWDIIDLVRACYALRPEGLVWAQHETGKPSFRLEDLCKANNIEHESAHNALSDVYATIAVAKLIKQKQTKLYDFYWQLREKQQVSQYLHKFLGNVLVYVSGFINSEQGCCTLILPICEHPSNKNAVLCIDLLAPVSAFLASKDINNKSAEIAELIFMRDAAEVARPRLHSIATNRCPFIAPYKTLTPESASRFGIDVTLALSRADKLKQAPQIAELCQQVYAQRRPPQASDNIDQALYSIGFPEPADSTTMNYIRESEPEQLVGFQGKFINEKLNELLFRYRARNYPHLLEVQEAAKWQQHLEKRFMQAGKADCLSAQEYITAIEELRNQHLNNPRNQQILSSLQRYGEQMFS